MEAQCEAPARLVFGTRPKVIKLAPVVLEARHRASEFKVVTPATGQHPEMLPLIPRAGIGGQKDVAHFAPELYPVVAREAFEVMRDLRAV